MTKRVLFLAAFVVSLAIPGLADRAHFQGRTMSSGSAAAVPNRLTGAVLFHEALMAPHTGATQGVVSVNDHREEWHYTLSGPVFGAGQGVLGSVVGDSVDASSRRSLASLVKVDNGVISISVPEPATVGTLAIGLAMIVCLMRHKPSKFMTISKSFLH